MKGPNWKGLRSTRVALRGWTKTASLGLITLAVAAAVTILIREGAKLPFRSLRLNPVWLGLSFLTVCIGILLAVIVWHRVLASFDVHQPFWSSLRIYCYSAVGVALPGSIWPMAGRSLLAQRSGASGARVATASIIESFVIGVAAMAVYAGCILLQSGVNLWTQPWVGIGFTALALILIYPPVFNSLSTWVLRRSKRVAEPITINVHLRELIGWVLVESVMVGIGGVALFFLLSSLVAAPRQTLLPLVIAWAASSAVGNLFFWLPATSLLRDGALILALTPSLSAPVAILFALLARVWSIASLLLIAGLIWLWLDSPICKSRRSE
jgi:uncharacterized membrane protein YbhN (UPF0104 family)